MGRARPRDPRLQSVGLCCCFRRRGILVRLESGETPLLRARSNAAAHVRKRRTAAIARAGCHINHERVCAPSYQRCRTVLDLRTHCKHACAARAVTRSAQQLAGRNNLGYSEHPAPFRSRLGLPTPLVTRTPRPEGPAPALLTSVVGSTHWDAIRKSRLDPHCELSGKQNAVQRFHTKSYVLLTRALSWQPQEERERGQGSTRRLNHYLVRLAGDQSCMGGAGIPGDSIAVD